MTPSRPVPEVGRSRRGRTRLQHFTHRLWTCVASSPNPTRAGDTLLRHADDTVHSTPRRVVGSRPGPAGLTSGGQHAPWGCDDGPRRQKGPKHTEWHQEPSEGTARVFEATCQFVRADPFRVGLLCGFPAAKMACPAPARGLQQPAAIPLVLIDSALGRDSVSFTISSQGVQATQASGRGQLGQRC